MKEWKITELPLYNCHIVSGLQKNQELGLFCFLLISLSQFKIISKFFAQLSKSVCIYIYTYM